MKKRYLLAVFIIATLLAVIFISNIEVTTKQGLNYKVYTLKIPLYLKTLDFYDRHFNYKWLVHKIIEGKTTEGEKVIAIFNWTIENIVKQPKGLRAVDDHVWHIIIRGYGTVDQFSDVFTTLCNYAGVDAFFTRLFNKDRTSQLPFSFVKVSGRWCLFFPYGATYFVNRGGNFASVEEIANGNWLEKNVGDFQKSDFKYGDYFDEILAINFERVHKKSRANIQSPINRLIFGIKNLNFLSNN